MNEKSEKLGVDEFINILRDKVKDERISPAKTAVTVGEMRSLLERLGEQAGQSDGMRKLKEAILDTLTDFEEHNPKADGLLQPFIWRQLLAKFTVGSQTVEKALEELIQEDKIETRREGVTYYRIKDPETKSGEPGEESKPESENEKQT